MSALADPAPHHILRGFLGEEMVGRLLDLARAREADFSESGVGDKQRRIDLATRRSRLLRDFGDLEGELRPRFAAAADIGIRELRVTPFEVVPMTLDLVAHGDGAFYRRHTDIFSNAAERKTNRALSGVYYFHAEPKGFAGGALRLHPLLPGVAEGRYVDIPPERDTLVLFPSWAQHEVMPVSVPSGEFMKSRFAINCWYHFRQGA